MILQSLISSTWSTPLARASIVMPVCLNIAAGVDPDVVRSVITYTLTTHATTMRATCDTFNLIINTLAIVFLGQIALT